MIAVQTITLNGDHSWTFAWTSTGAAYYRVVLWGIELARVTDTTYTWHGQEYKDFPPPLEIAEESEQALSERFLPFFLIQWYGEPCEQYLVQWQDAGNAWVTVERVQNGNQWVYTYQTPTLRDGNIYNYKVIAVDEVGNQSTPRYYQRRVVCPPMPPDGEIAITYNGGNVTVSAQ